MEGSGGQELGPGTWGPAPVSLEHKEKTPAETGSYAWVGEADGCQGWGLRGPATAPLVIVDTEYNLKFPLPVAQPQPWLLQLVENTTANHPQPSSWKFPLEGFGNPASARLPSTSSCLGGSPSVHTGPFL